MILYATKLTIKDLNIPMMVSSRRYNIINYPKDSLVLTGEFYFLMQIVMKDRNISIEDIENAREIQVLGLKF